MAADEESLPQEIEGPCEEFHQSLLRTDTVLKKLLAIPTETLDEKLTTLDKARLNVTLCYAIDSLFWAFLTVQGISPREHAVKKELDRVRQYMGKLKEIEEKDRKPEQRVNKDAAKRFVRNALWEPSDKNEADEEDGMKDKEKMKETDPAAEFEGMKKREKRKQRRESHDEETMEDEVPTESSVKKKKKKKQKESREMDGTASSAVHESHVESELKEIDDPRPNKTGVKKKRKETMGAYEPVAKNKKRKSGPE